MRPFVSVTSGGKGVCRGSEDRQGDECLGTRIARLHLLRGDENVVGTSSGAVVVQFRSHEFVPGRHVAGGIGRGQGAKLIELVVDEQSSHVGGPPFHVFRNPHRGENRGDAEPQADDDQQGEPPNAHRLGDVPDHPAEIEVDRRSGVGGFATMPHLVRVAQHDRAGRVHVEHRPTLPTLQAAIEPVERYLALAPALRATHRNHGTSLGPSRSMA